MKGFLKGCGWFFGIWFAIGIVIGGIQSLGKLIFECGGGNMHMIDRVNHTCAWGGSFAELIANLDMLAFLIVPFYCLGFLVWAIYRAIERKGTQTSGEPHRKETTPRAQKIAYGIAVSLVILVCIVISNALLLHFWSKSLPTPSVEDSPEEYGVLLFPTTENIPIFSDEELSKPLASFAPERDAVVPSNVREFRRGVIQSRNAYASRDSFALIPLDVATLLAPGSRGISFHIEPERFDWKVAKKSDGNYAVEYAVNNFDNYHSTKSRYVTDGREMISIEPMSREVMHAAPEVFLMDIVLLILLLTINVRIKRRFFPSSMSAAVAQDVAGALVHSDSAPAQINTAESAASVPPKPSGPGMLHTLIRGDISKWLKHVLVVTAIVLIVIFVGAYFASAGS